MRAVLAIAVLMTTAMPSFAAPNLVPEPESMALLAVAGLAMWVARRKK